MTKEEFLKKRETTKTLASLAPILMRHADADKYNVPIWNDVIPELSPWQLTFLMEYHIVMEMKIPPQVQAAYDKINGIWLE